MINFYFQLCYLNSSQSLQLFGLTFSIDKTLGTARDPFLKAARGGTVSRPSPFRRLGGSAWACTGYPLSLPGPGYGEEPGLCGSLSQGHLFLANSAVLLASHCNRNWLQSASYCQDRVDGARQPCKAIHLGDGYFEQKSCTCQLLSSMWQLLHLRDYQHWQARWWREGCTTFLHLKIHLCR